MSTTSQEFEALYTPEQLAAMEHVRAALLQNPEFLDKGTDERATS